VAIPAPKPMIDTCNACGKLFPRVTMRLCTHCALVEEHRFELVRDYLIENDGAPLGEIARETGVSMSDVRSFTDGGRLIEVTGLNECTCTGIGNRCRYCRSRLSNSFRELEQTMRREHADKPTDSETGRTSYVRRIRRLGE
jgi:hypothetical protein